MSPSNEPAAGAARPARRAAVLGVAALLCACAAGPDFVPPAAPTTRAYGAAPLADAGLAGTALEPGAAAPAEWWMLFAAPRLDAAVRLALHGNHDLAAARASLVQAALIAHAGSAGLYPRVEMDAGAGHEKLGAASLGSVQFPAFNYYSVGPAVSFALDYTGGMHRAVEAQYAQVDAQRYQFEATRLSLAGNVALAALHIAAARAQIDRVQDLLREDARNLEYVQQSFDAGSVSRLDVLSAQTQLAGDQTLLAPLQQQLGLARHQLSALVGRAPADWSVPDFDLQEIQVLRRLPLALPSALVRKRPDILAAEAQLHAASAALGVATANLYPQITLSAALSLQAVTPRRLFEASGLVGEAGAGLTTPIFDHGALRDRQGAAREAVQAALDRYEQVVLESFVQVADLLDALEHDAQLEQAQQRAVDAASATLELARESYRAGNVGVLPVLDAQRADQQAQLGLVRAHAQRVQDQMQLLVATGGSLPPVEQSGSGAAMASAR